MPSRILPEADEITVTRDEIRVGIGGGKEMRLWRLAAALVLAAIVAGCGGNSTPVGVTVTGAGIAAGSTVTVLINGNEQFTATVSGASTSTVYWQICLPASVSTTQPTTCTSAQGPAACTLPTGTLTGYGTVTPNGLYTAPPAVPQTNSFDVVATSCIDSTAFGIATVAIRSGVVVQISPTAVTIGQGEHFQFSATVGGAANTGVSWSVSAATAGNPAGTITPNGPQTALFVAPSTPGPVNVKATSAFDSSQSATAVVTVGSAADPTITAIDPGLLPRDPCSRMFTLPARISLTPVSSELVRSRISRRSQPLS